MFAHFRKFVSILTVFTFALMVVPPVDLIAADHIVKIEDLHKKMLTKSQTRLQNVTKIQQFLSTEPARQALKQAAVDPVKIEKAIPQLTDEELARIAAQADQVQRNFAAGYVDRDIVTLLLIVLLVVAVIVVVGKA